MDEEITFSDEEIALLDGGHEALVEQLGRSYLEVNHAWRGIVPTGTQQKAPVTPLEAGQRYLRNAGKKVSTWICENGNSLTAVGGVVAMDVTTSVKALALAKAVLPALLTAAVPAYAAKLLALLIGRALAVYGHEKVCAWLKSGGESELGPEPVAEEGAE